MIKTHNAEYTIKDRKNNVLAIFENYDEAYEFVQSYVRRGIKNLRTFVKFKNHYSYGN